MKQLLLRLYHWLGRLLGELDTPRYRRETDWLPRGGKQSAAAAPPRPHLRMRTPPGEGHRQPPSVSAECASSDAPPGEGHHRLPSVPAECASSDAPLATIPQPSDPLQPSFDLHTGEAPRFALSRSVLTPPEQRFYISLLRAVDNQYSILAKVRLGDIVWLVNDPPDRKRHQSRVWCKHVDFLLCDRVGLKPRLAIELDDPSHRYPDHAARDQFKNDLFAAVGLPLLRVELESSYRADVLRSQIAAKLETKK